MKKNIAMRWIRAHPQTLEGTMKNCCKKDYSPSLIFLLVASAALGALVLWAVK